MPDSIHLRPITEADMLFLARLYASTREAELSVVPWSDEEKATFLRWQFKAQTLHYSEHYSEADFLIIERDGVPIGRIYLDRTPEEIEIVDIALVPECRGAGLGTQLLGDVLREAGESGRSVKIYVEHFNPARHLYDRLGFRHVDTNGVYHLMRWTRDGD